MSNDVCLFEVEYKFRNMMQPAKKMVSLEEIDNLLTSSTIEEFRTIRTL